jgi:hypothetical protein
MGQKTERHPVKDDTDYTDCELTDAEITPGDNILGGESRSDTGGEGNTAPRRRRRSNYGETRRT